MAINLWKLGGQATAYNPLPVGLTSISLGIGTFSVKIKAKAIDNSHILRLSATGIDIRFNLNTESKEYVSEFNNSTKQNVGISRYTGTGDIIIESIELVEKPLPKLTINGIDGFQSGKWSLHANAKVIDDETLELNATSTGQISELIFDCLPNADYTMSGDINGTFEVRFLNSASTVVGSANTLTSIGSVAFKTTTDTSKIRVRLFSGGSGKFIFKRPMLNLGSIPAPYSKKTGERMVFPTAKKNMFDGQYELGYLDGNSLGESLYPSVITRTTKWFKVKPNTQYVLSGNTNRNNWQFKGGGVYTALTQKDVVTTPNNAEYARVYYANYGGTPPADLGNNVQVEEGVKATSYEPYAVQLNPKPNVKVPKKNLFNGVYTNGKRIISTGLETNDVLYGITDYIPVKGITALVNNKWKDTYSAFYDFNKVLIGSGVWGATKAVPNNAFYHRESFLLTDLYTLQLEEGSTATPYEPYQLVLPKARTGLVMDGLTNYLQLPSMAMDSIEIDCLIDAVQPKTYYYLMDARNGLPNGFAVNDIASGGSGIGTGLSKVFIDGVETASRSFNTLPKNTRTKIKFNANQFTDDVTIFATSGGSWQLKGILYGVKCYLNGQVVASYDFTNPNNIVGDKILNGTAKNLIPGFEDSLWNLHSNFKVLGKDVGRLDASANSSVSYLFLPVLPNKQYLLNVFGTGKVWIAHYDENMNYLGLIQGVRDIQGMLNVIYTMAANTKFIQFQLTNYTTLGTFDFIKPQLYQLDGKEGTLFGSPSQLLKPAKRVLYARR
jgi:hypothetical protein